MKRARNKEPPDEDEHEDGFPEDCPLKTGGKPGKGVGWCRSIICDECCYKHGRITCPKEGEKQ